MRILVASNTGEAGVTQAIVRGPFQKLDASHDKWVKPTALSHFRRRHALAPTPFATVRQIAEGASLFPQGPEMRQQGPSILGWDAGPDTAGVDQFALFVISDQD